MLLMLPLLLLALLLALLQVLAATNFPWDIDEALRRQAGDLLAGCELYLLLECGASSSGQQVAAATSGL